MKTLLSGLIKAAWKQRSESMDSSETYDIAIIGYGPAGITAGIYAARKKLKVVLFGDLPGGEVRNSGDIENWPGDGETDGVTLADKMIKHLELHKDDVSVVAEKVTQIAKDDTLFTTTTQSGKIFTSKTVIYAAGRAAHATIPAAHAHE
jgi:thioredoxin reductase